MERCSQASALPVVAPRPCSVSARRQCSVCVVLPCWPMLPPAGCTLRRLSTVRNADQTVVMDRGRVAEVGTHTQLMRRGGIYAALVRRQSGAVLDQERDLAPHERQVGEGGGGEGHGPDGDAGGSAEATGSSDALAGDPALPDSLPQWKQEQRVKAEHDTA